MQRSMLISAAVAALLGLSAMAALAQSGSDKDKQTLNPYSPANGHPYRHGAVPTQETWRKMQAYASKHAAGAGGAAAEQLAYGGGVDGIGVTSGTPVVYIVFWGSQWGTQSTDGNGNMTFSNDPAKAAPYLQQLFKGIGTGGELWSGTMTQYCDGPNVATGATSCPANAPNVGYPTGGPLAGVWYDNSGTEPSVASAQQLGQEAVAAASHFGNTTPSSNRYAQYIIVSSTGTFPDGFNTPGSGFCAWHDWNGDVAATSTVGDIAFTNMPYVYDAGPGCGQNFVNTGAAGTDDGFSIVNGHEYAETVTDQNPAGGWTNHQNDSYGGEEVGDECAWLTSGAGAAADVTMGTGSFAMQSIYSNDTNSCTISHAVVVGGASDTPIASNRSVTTYTNTSVSGILSAYDPDEDALTFAIVANPAHGTVTINNASTGAFTYTPANGYTGSDSFTFQATDSASNASNVATDSVTVSPMNSHCPVGYTKYTGVASSGGQVFEPQNHYYVAGAGNENGQLAGPPSSNFDLFLYKYNSARGWQIVAASTGPTSTQSISYSGTSGYYEWDVYALSGSGGFTFCLQHP
jgi:serine protease